MHRRYSLRQQCFDQPDPYDGSYDLSDPQSLNRYAYTRNDPVNFVDPSGLNMVAGGGGCWLSWRAIGHFVGKDLVGMSNFTYTITCPFGRGGGGGNLQQSATREDNSTDCERMADDAQRIAEQTRKNNPGANAAYVLQQFNKDFGRISFASYFAEGPLGFIGTGTSSGRNPSANRKYQGDSGFHPDFRDSLNPGEDQVHHFGAYFSAGLAGHKLAPDQHRAGDRGDGNWGDVRLADHARLLGDYLRRNPSQLDSVGQLIRDTICNGGAVPK